MLIEVTATHPPQPGKKMAHILAADGSKFEIWPDRLDKVQVGQRYEVETREREFNGRTIRSIEKISPASSASVGKSETYRREVGNMSSQASPSGEAQFVGRVLAALIAKGEVEKSQIAAATEWLRKVWRDTQHE